MIVMQCIPSWECDSTTYVVMAPFADEVPDGGPTPFVDLQLVYTDGDCWVGFEWEESPSEARFYA